VVLKVVDPAEESAAIAEQCAETRETETETIRSLCSSKEVIQWIRERAIMGRAKTARFADRAGQRFSSVAFSPLVGIQLII
jgi:hypothetical protein